MTIPRKVALGLAVLIFLSAGVGHFANPDPFVLIVPAYLPAPKLLVAVSGLFEILGAVGLLIPRVRVAAGFGLLALLLAVFPANVNMLMNEIYLPGMPEEIWLLWVRMPVQLVFAGLVLFGSGIWPRVGSEHGGPRHQAPVLRGSTGSR